MCCCTMSLCQYTHTVCIVYKKTCAIFTTKIYNFWQWCNIAAHTVNAVNNYHSASLVIDLTQDTFQVSHVAVFKALHLCEGEDAAIHDTCVILFISNDDV